MTDAATRRRVLIVEDEAALLRVYERRYGNRYHLALAESGAQARRLFETFAPEVVVLDLQLPDADGVDLLREFRAANPSLPVLITSAYASMKPVVEVLGLEHSGYLVKPFDLDELGHCIDDLH